MSIGSIIDGKYELVSLAGEGGMASVYKAMVRGAAGFARPVGVKKIKPEFRAMKNYIAMFVEEARVGAELAHPNIVQVHDFVSENGLYYLIMEWVEGMDAGTLLRIYREAMTPVPWQVVLAIGVGTLRGLGAAHERRAADGSLSPVIHRDVSPHNILLGNNGAVKLSDFGLARARDRAASLTAPGTVKGKLAYLAPEVTFGKPNSPQSDIFSTGVVMWEALTQQRLFDGKSDLEVFKKIRACAVPAISDYRSDIPREVDEAIRKGLAAQPEQRFASANQFAFELSNLLSKQPLDAHSMLVAAIADAQARDAGEEVDIHSLSSVDSTAGTQSFDIEFSSPDLSAEPITLPPKKRQ